MTPQEIFDIVYKHLVTQGRQSRNDIGYCMYRSPKGLKCAVGCLIPDELYDPGMDQSRPGESSSITEILQSYPELPDWMHRHQRLLSDLQHAHDTDELWDPHNNRFSEHGHDAVRDIARHHKLDFISLEP